MAKIGFLGLGNMGRPMALNLVKAGHQLTVHDPAPDGVAALVAEGAVAVGDAGSVAAGSEVVITMLPAGRHVRSVYGDPGGILDRAAAGLLAIDCSTIDVDTARTVAATAAAKGVPMLDAPVSGGTGGAAAGTLTFMCGGEEAAFARALPLLEVMGKTIVHAGPSGNGQAAKICNNMILGVSMIGVAEAFALADRLGLSAQTLFDISSKSSGQCWSMTTYCPVPGPVPTSPANRDYQPGFTAAMMLKDLRLAQQAALAAGAATPMGAEAAALYGLFCGQGNAELDFSAIVKMLSAK